MSNVFGSEDDNDDDDVRAFENPTHHRTGNPSMDPVVSLDSSSHQSESVMRPFDDPGGASANQNESYKKARMKRRKNMDISATEEVVDKLASNSGLDQNVPNTRTADEVDDDLPTSLLATSAHDDLGSHRNVPTVNKAREKRKKKRKHTRVETDAELTSFPVDSIQADIVHLNQNIVNAPEDFRPKDTEGRQQVWHTNVQSQPVGKIFVEHEKGFKAFEEWKLTKTLASSLLRMQSGSRNPMTKSANNECLALELGLSLHSYTKRLANYCHGILAGFALWQCVMVYRLTSATFSSFDFVEHYSFMASLAQALFYVLTAICLVSVMGRCGIGNSSGNWLRQLGKPSASVVALIIYFVTLLLSLFVADFDDELALHEQKNNYNLTTNFDIEDSEIQTWKNLNLFRCLGAMVAWLALAVSPDQDLLYDSIQSLAADEDDAQMLTSL